jgi:aminotransferase
MTCPAVPVRAFVSARAASLTSSRLANLLRLARQRHAIDLSLGVPEFPRPARSVIEQACVALREGDNQYADPAGEFALREAIANGLNTPADPDTEITVTTGASEALCVALLCTIDPGDEVIVLEPFYEHFLSAIRLAGGIPRCLRLRPPDWRFDPAELRGLFGPRTRCVVLNTPHNPTGRVLGLGELNLIAELCERWNVTVISDEVYSSYVFDGRTHISVADLPQLRDRSIVVGSLSKTYALSGWRLGFLRAEAARSAVMRRAQIVTTAGSVAPLQTAVVASGVLQNPGDEPAATMQLRRDQAVAMLQRLGLRCGPVEGGCYALADISELTEEDSEAFVRRLLMEAGVLIAPGTLFTSDFEAGRRWIRVAFNRSAETLGRAERNLRSVGLRYGARDGDPDDHFALPGIHP